MNRPALLVDASVYVFRAWFSLPATLTAPDGRPVNAFYGFARFLLELLVREQPRAIVCAFDESLTSSFRNEFYPDYKANREPAPEELKAQFAWCRSLCRALGVLELADGRYEADDLIGSVMHRHRAAFPGFSILTRDKDLAQLVGPNDEFWDYGADLRLDSDGIARRFGLPPARIAELLALTGDAVDNIPGVPGIGPKTAVALLAAFGSLDELMARLGELPASGLRGAKRLQGLLESHRQTVAMARRLTVIATDAPVPGDPAALHRGEVDWPALDSLFAELGVGERLRGMVRALDA
ncbi:MAG: hypothetical protein JJU27_03450 [Gammaproteobacteria bacterium]|nr:hypothetical protein [Gammaproteobacteria bacterium]